MANFKKGCQMFASIIYIALFGSNWGGTRLLELLLQRQRASVPQHGRPVLTQAGGV